MSLLELFCHVDDFWLLFAQVWERELYQSSKRPACIFVLLNEFKCCSKCRAVLYAGDFRSWYYQQLKHWLEVVYMTERIHELLRYVTPAEFEAAALATSYPLLNPT